MAIKRPQAIDDAPVRAAAQRRMAAWRLSCLREEWAKPRGKKVVAPPLRQGDRGAAGLWPDRAIDETASVVCRTACGKAHGPWGHARGGVTEREIANLAHAKAPCIPEPRLAEKMQSPTLFVRTISAWSITAAGEHAFTASLTADTADITQPTSKPMMPYRMMWLANNLPVRGKI